MDQNQSVVVFVYQEKKNNKHNKGFRNGDTPNNKDTCKLRKHAQCWSVLKNRLDPIARRMKKDGKGKTEQQKSWRTGIS